MHRHEFHELVLILDGQAKHTMDGVTHEIGKGDVFLVRGDMSHGYTSASVMDLVNILFAPRRLGLPLEALREVPGYHVLFHLEPRFREQHGFGGRLHLTADQLGLAIRLVALLEEELTRKPAGYRFMARTRLMELLGFLARCCSGGGSGRARGMLRIGEALGFLHRRSAERVTLGQLARVAGMSQSAFVRAFRQATGASPIEYLIRLRVERAADALCAGDARVTEAALQAGFSDSNYFSRQFRKVMGMSPRQYKTRHAHAPDTGLFPAARDVEPDPPARTARLDKGPREEAQGRREAPAWG